MTTFKEHVVGSIKHIANAIQAGQIAPKEAAQQLQAVLADLPIWQHSDKVYSYLYSVLEKLGQDAWKQEVARAKKTRRKVKGITPTDEMDDIIKALDKGDEEELKGLQLKYKTQNYYQK